MQRKNTSINDIGIDHQVLEMIADLKGIRSIDIISMIENIEGKVIVQVFIIF